MTSAITSRVDAFIEQNPSLKIALCKLETKLPVNRVHIFMVLVVFNCCYLVFGFEPSLAASLIGFVYPLYQTCIQFCQCARSDVAHCEQIRLCTLSWVAYWLEFCGFILFEPLLHHTLLFWLPCFALFKALLFVYLMSSAASTTSSSSSVTVVAVQSKALNWLCKLSEMLRPSDKSQELGKCAAANRNAATLQQQKQKQQEGEEANKEEYGDTQIRARTNQDCELPNCFVIDEKIVQKEDEDLLREEKFCNVDSDAHEQQQSQQEEAAQQQKVEEFDLEIVEATHEEKLEEEEHKEELEIVERSCEDLLLTAREQREENAPITAQNLQEREDFAVENEKNAECEADVSRDYDITLADRSITSELHQHEQQQEFEATKEEQKKDEEEKEQEIDEDETDETWINMQREAEMQQARQNVMQQNEEEKEDDSETQDVVEEEDREEARRSCFVEDAEQMNRMATDLVKRQMEAALAEVHEQKSLAADFETP